MNATNDPRTRIVKAAGDLLYAKSYGEVGVAAICEAAGVKKGSFYHFFPSKQDLTVEVLEHAWQAMKAELLDRAFRADRSPMERIERFARLAYEYQKDLAERTGQVYGCPFGNMAAEQATQDEQLRIKTQEIFARMQQALEATLREALQRGDIAGIDPSATAAAMYAYSEGVMLLAKTANDADVIARLLPAMVRIRIPSESS
ncbi:TetR/AcrR family transcriptional regulator [Thiohalocapsa sp.]|jgi:TetR/AcrR family transcriptional repressor of nem operon|uniref:TetR/AcrR family transcriptional regulator n=1 Tax=Thiohalocapsa sp. TaxID=2497641 RepID=UPI0025F1A7D6|nr:TetR/AcrR family transcriptional regulator [Thiohalocapsa sp.]